MEELVRYDQTVARVETLRDIAGKIKPLLNENNRVFAILQMSGQVSRGSAGEYQADERAGVARLSWRVSGR